MTNDEQEFEPALDVETSPMMEPISEMVCRLPTAGTSPPKYWQAQNLASALHKEFEELKKKGDIKEMRGRFFILARYYGRTMGILRQALASGNGALINAALRNLITLHQPLHHMHEVSPTGVPFVITLDRDMRRRLVDDLVIQVLMESPEPLPLETITSQVNDLHFMANAKDNIISQHLDNLIDGGHVQRVGDGFTQTKGTYNSINLDHSSLQALLGEKLYLEFEKGGFPGLSNIVDRKESFKKFFHRFTNCGTDMAEMFIAASIELFGTPSVTPETSSWKHSNLIGSLIPRPYQYDAFAIFRGYGYKGQVIESPSGSGKTMIGMMCIQDWLRALSPGMSILVLVPTVNYEQQWVSELCYKPIGLQVSSDIVFTGTPAELEAERKRSGFSPAILVMTYTALAQLGSPAGKGGFDKISVERFLQGNNIQYVILDEVHKVVENLKSVSAMVTQLLTEWLEDGSLSGLIGFSGTAAAYRDRFDKLGLQLAYTMPAADLIAYGFVAPFAEYGVPFTYSDRERHAIDLLKEYKSYLIEYVDILGIDRLKKLFANIPLEKRIVIGKDILRQYSGRKDQDSALEKRYTGWEQGDKFTLNELPIILMIQIAENLSDKALFEKTIIDSTDEEKEKKRRGLQEIIIKIDKIRDELKGLIYFPDLTSRLNAENFGSTFNAENIWNLSSQITNRSAFKEQVKDELAFSLVGLYTSLKNLYYRMGEGRVDSIRSIIDAEHSSRKVSGVIIFDAAKRIREERDTSVPGYAGVGGLFAQMLGDDRLTPMAAISSEIYLPWNEKNPLTYQISDYIRQEIMLNELGNAFFNLVTQKSGLSKEQLSSLKVSFDALLKEYFENLINVGASRPSEFNRKVIKKFRRLVNESKPDINIKKLSDKLSLKHHHVRMWVDNFFDYALIASRFHEAKTAKLRQAGGIEQKLFVVKMAQGERKQLMYELISRVVDAESIPINVIIVSTWARTGWNVISPNILIDATATRNVTAWQQLRGRAMRASLTWDRDCYELVMILLGSHLRGIEEAAEKLPPDVFAMEEFQQRHEVTRKLNDKQKELILEAHQFAQSSLKNQAGDMISEETLVDKIMKGRLNKLKEEEKELLAAELMISRNKVTHIYELVKAYGSAPQVRLDRTSKTWHRNEAIAAKHLHEYSINPVTGSYSSGEGHAPLIYVDDPRKNVPSKFRNLMKNELKGRDPVIVNGWIKAVVSGVDEDRSLT